MQASRSIVVIGFVLALALPAAGQEVMYGCIGFGTPNGAFGTVDQTNGNFTLIGDPTSGDDHLSGLAFDSSGRLFATIPTSVNSEKATTLIEINPNDGSLKLIIGHVLNGTTNLRITDLATQPSTDRLFGIDNNGSLFTINKSTAAATLIGPTTLDEGGIAFDPDGTLYLATTGSKLARLDPATAKPIVGQPMLDLTDCIDGLAVRPSDGALFGTACEDNNAIYLINAATGELTLLGKPDNFDATDLAFKIAPLGVRAPAVSPAALALIAAGLAAGGVVALTKRRRSLTAGA